MGKLLMITERKMERGDVGQLIERSERNLKTRIEAVLEVRGPSKDTLVPAEFMLHSPTAAHAIVDPERQKVAIILDNDRSVENRIY
jgi:hypothetical protein